MVVSRGNCCNLGFRSIFDVPEQDSGYAQLSRRGGRAKTMTVSRPSMKRANGPFGVPHQLPGADQGRYSHQLKPWRSARGQAFAFIYRQRNQSQLATLKLYFSQGIRLVR